MLVSKGRGVRLPRRLRRAPRRARSRLALAPGSAWCLGAVEQVCPPLGLPTRRVPNPLRPTDPLDMDETASPHPHTLRSGHSAYGRESVLFHQKMSF